MGPRGGGGVNRKGKLSVFFNEARGIEEERLNSVLNSSTGEIGGLLGGVFAKLLVDIFGEEVVHGAYAAAAVKGVLTFVVDDIFECVERCVVEDPDEALEGTRSSGINLKGRLSNLDSGSFSGVAAQWVENE